MKLSVLIVNYNRGDLLRRCLASIGSGVEVIVADNGSEDAVSRSIPAEFPEVLWLALGENLGFSVGMNRAAAQATGDVLLLLNPDTELQPGSLERMIESQKEAPSMGAVGFRQVDPTGNYQLSIGLRPGLLTELLRRFVQRALDRGNTRLGSWIDQRLSRRVCVPWVGGSAVLLRRSAFETIGGFDEGFPLYFEDIDLCLRLAQAVGPIYYDPSVTIIHHRGASALTNQQASRRFYRQSQLYFWEKHGSAWGTWIVRTYLRFSGHLP